jgi:hypothetical protein
VEPEGATLEARIEWLFGALKLVAFDAVLLLNELCAGDSADSTDPSRAALCISFIWLLNLAFFLCTASALRV